MKELYQFELYDIGADRYVRSRRLATIQYIQRIVGAKIAEDTKKEVDDNQVDADGLLLEVKFQCVLLPGILSKPAKGSDYWSDGIENVLYQT